MKWLLCIIALIILYADEEVTKSMNYRVVEFKVNIFKGFREMPPDMDKVIWLNWSIQKCKISAINKLESSKCDRDIISKIKKQNNDLIIRKLSECSWRHWKNPETEVPRRFCVFIKDDCEYLMEFSTTNGKYSLKIYKEAFYNGKKINRLLPDKRIEKLSIEDILIDGVISFENSVKEKFFLTFSRNEIPTSQLVSSNKPSNSIMYYSILRYKTINYPKLIRPEISEVEDVLIDINFDFYGKFRDAYYLFGHPKIINFIREKFGDVIINRYMNIPSYFCLRSKLIFIKGSK